MRNINILSRFTLIAFFAIALVASVSLTTNLGSAQGTGFTQCSDGFDNNGNGLIDADDPACHTDWDASNPLSYDPNINAEQGTGPVWDSGGSSGCSSGLGCTNPPPPSNRAPVCSNKSFNINGGNNISFNLNSFASDPDGDNLSFNLQNRPSGSNFNSSGSFNWSTTNSDAGTYDMQYIASDGSKNCSGTITLKITKTTIDHGTGLSCSNPSFSIREGDFLTFDLHNYISGTNSHQATFNMGNRPSGSSFNNVNGVFTWNTFKGDQGSYNINYNAFLGQKSCSGNISLKVIKKDDSSDLSVSCRVDKRNVEVGETVRFTADIDGGRSPFDIDWRGDIRGSNTTERVSFNRAGTYDVSVRVQDNNGNRDSATCSSVRVTDTGRPPAGTSPPFFTTTPLLSATVGISYLYNANAVDPDGTTIAYNMISGPSGMTINPNTGLIQWIPSSAQSNQSHFVQIRATDRQGEFATQSFSVFVSPRFVPQPPIPPQPPITRLQIFDLSVTSDQSNNVIVSYRTNISASSRVYYSLNSHFEDRTAANYENQVAGPSNATFHQVNLGQLELNRTYYLRAFAWTSNDSALTGELAFIQLATGVVAGASTCPCGYVDEFGVFHPIGSGANIYGYNAPGGAKYRNGVADASFGSALATIGSLFLNPWFLLFIIIILLIILLMRRGRETFISSGRSGPVEIRS